MSPPGHELQPRERESSQDRLQQVTRINRLLAAVLVVLLVAAAGFGGWLFGREHPPAAPPAHAGHAHANCPLQLPPRGEALVRGVRCGHGTLIVDAHCDESHGMHRFILDLIQQKASDEEIKAALLRRYGEKVLAGREW